MSKVSEATKAKRRTATLLPPGRASKRLSVSCARNVPLPKPRTACGVKRQAGRLPSTPSVRCVALYGTLCVCIVSVVHLHPTVVAPAPSSSLFAVPRLGQAAVRHLDRPAPDDLTLAAFLRKERRLDASVDASTHARDASDVACVHRTCQPIRTSLSRRPCSSASKQLGVSSVPVPLAFERRNSRGG